jgi:hypothetical protein
MKTLLAVAIMLLPGAAWAGQTIEKKMPTYEACLVVIQITERDLGVSGKTILQGAHTRQVSFATTDGPVIVGCYKDGTMMMTMP